MKKHLTLAISILIVTTLGVTRASAQNPDFGPIHVHVTQILNIANAPLNFDFVTENLPSACNGAIFYFATGSDEATQLANGNANLAALLAIQLSGRTIDLWGINPAGGFNFCKVVFIHFNNQ